jgi:hypothetical protein
MPSLALTNRRDEVCMNLALPASAMLAALALPLPLAFAQAAPSCSGSTVTGTIRDTTAALIPGASITLDATPTVTSDSTGQFRIPCIAPGHHTLSASASGFAQRALSVTAPHPSPLNLVLDPAAVDTTLDVAATDTGPDKSPTSSGPSQTIAGKQLDTLADDPDDLLRELQQLSAAAGGSPSAATVAVDGFDNGEGGTHLPPKSSIAYIKVNPDLFSAEYRNPPFGGGRIEIYTKPGQSNFHGALFATNSSSWMNAHDPFSTASTPLGKQRYGFELTGPIRKKGSDFLTSLEHRTINTDAVVNAITVNAAGTQTPVLQTVAAPQYLWLGNAKIDWQLGSKNTLIASIDTFNNDLQNFGVGGTNLPETGYDRRLYDYNIHLTDVTTISPKIMHEARIGLEFDGYTYTPNSTAPQVSVAGAFTAGGASVGPAHEREMWTTLIDDAIIQTKAHLIKVGIQPEFIHITQHVPTNFNGSYSFGGGVTSTGATLTGIQQYVNALNGAPNGAPTAFSNVAGNPEVEVFEFRNAIYYQDDWKALSNLHFAYGLRYYTQTTPTNTTALQPRIGVSWSPDKKATWSLHAHAGLFSGRNGAHQWAQIQFMDGVQRVTSTVYNPATYCPNGISSTCTPFAGATVAHSIRTVQPNFANQFYGIENIGFTKTFPKGFSLSGDYYIDQLWHDARSENVNSPLNGQPTGPRPGAANLNVLQFQGSGRGYGNVEFMGLSNQSLKRIQFFAGAVRVDIVNDTDGSSFFTPQSTGVNAGEYARQDTNGLWQIFGNATLNLPAKLVWSANYNGQGGTPYNVTTGFDNNGDGDFNDRPQYAPAGTPLCSANPNATPCGYNTPWGELVTSGGIGSLPRNKGMMPWTFYLDTNLQRAFKLTHNAKADHPQTLTVNLRSSNVLNHENVTAVGSVLGSPQFGVPYTADNGRRVEAGLRYAF